MFKRNHAFLLAGTAVLPLCFSHSALAQGAMALPEIVVTAPSPIRRAPTGDGTGSQPQSTPPVIEDTFSAVTVVTKDQLQRSAGGTLGDVLGDKPGITSSSFAPGAASRPVIRGLDNFRVRVQENGIGSHDVSDLGEDHGVPIDPLAADQVEVVRGPATLRYGSQAIGGVVNVTNNRIPEAPKPGMTTQVRGAYTSVDRGTEGALLVDGGTKDFGFHADAFGRGTSDYKIPAYPYLVPPTPAPDVGGKQPNTGSHSEGQSIGGSYFFNGGFAGASVTHFNSIYHIPGIDGAATGTRIKMEQTKVNGKAEWRAPFSAVEALRLWVGVSEYRHSEIGVGGDGIDGTQAVFRNQEQEARLEMQLMPYRTFLGPVTTAVGGQFGHQQIGTAGAAGGLLSPAETRSAAAFVFNELKFTDLMRMQVAGRIETVNVNGTAATFPADFLGGGPDPVAAQSGRTFTPRSLSLGVLHDLPWNMVASATGQYVERAPRALELFSRGAHDASGTFEIGSADLKPEVAKTAEVGLKRARGAFRFEANAYYTEYQGFIYKRLTGNTCDEDFQTCVAGAGGEFRQVVYSQQNAIFRGAEAFAQLDVTQLGNGMLGIDGQYDIVRATFADGTNVPRMPPQRFGGGVWWRDANWYARVGLLHADAQNNISGFETRTDGYNLLKAELTYTTKLPQRDFGPKQMTVGIVGTNLLNEEVRNSVSFRKDDVLLPGAGVKLFANFTF